MWNLVNILLYMYLLGIWLKVEDMVWDFVVNYLYVYVISGLIFDENVDGFWDEDESIIRLVIELKLFL